MSLSKHSLSPSGRTAIDAFLREAVESERVPATFLGVTAAEAELYYDQQGERVFGEADKGSVDEHTSECGSTASCPRVSAESISSATLLLHQARDLCEPSVVLGE